MTHRRMLLGAALAAPLLVLAPAAHADWLFGVHGEAQYWNAKNSGSVGQNATEDWNWQSEGATRLSLSLNHPLPLIPNIMIERQWLESQGSFTNESGFNIGGITFDPAFSESNQLMGDFDLGHDSLTLYYRLFDNSLVEFYFGATAKRFNGSAQITDGEGVYSQKIDETIPMGYLRIAAGLPLTGLSVRAQGQVIAVGDHDGYDLEAAVRYKFLDTMVLDGQVSVGYRAFKLELDNANSLYTDFEFRGPFINVSLHF